MQHYRKPKKKKKLGSYPSLSVVFSITLALFVVGLFGLLWLFTGRLTDFIKEKVEVQIYLNNFVTESERMKIQKIIASKDYVLVKEGTPQIKFISKDEAAEKFVKDTGEDFKSFLGENPLRDAFVLNVKQEFQDKDKLSGIKSDIEGIKGVFEVTYMESLVNEINKNVTKISLILLAFAGLLIITVIILINSTIKLALFSQRFLIRSMQLVGATSAFIQRPFIGRALLHGILSGIIASALLAGILQYGYTRIEGLQTLEDTRKILILFGSLLILGALISVLSSYLSIRRYLKMSLDELY